MKKKFNPVTEILEISFPGDLLSTNVELFRIEAMSIIEAQFREGGKWLGAEVDLTLAQTVDSAGLNCIVSLIRKLKSYGKRALIRVKDPHVHRACLFTRLDLQAEIVRV